MSLEKAIVPKTTPSGRAPGKAALTRTEILIALAQLIVEKGSSDCNLREIADRVGIQPSSIYYHFSSKDELLDELLNLSVNLISNAVHEAIAELGPDATVRERVATGMRAHLMTTLGDNDDAGAIMRIYAYLPPAMKKRSRAVRAKYAALWKNLIDEGQRKGEIRADLDIDTLVSYLLSGMGASGEWYRPNRNTIEDVCRVITSLHMDGGL